MAYNKQKAHEYYENYTKKGKLKGRKKGTKKKSKKNTNLIGLSTAGLNEEGKMEFALMKEKLTNEMNTALKGAKSDSEKESIRREYQKKALSEVQRLKSSPQYQTAKKSSGSKSGGSKSSGSKSSGSKSSGSSGSKSSSSKSSSSSSTKKLNEISKQLDAIAKSLSTMTNEQKAAARTVLTDVINQLSKVKGADVSKIRTQLTGLLNGNI